LHDERSPVRSRRDAAALAAIGADVSAVCVRRLARVAGTHGVLLDGWALPAPSVVGVARWTLLQPSPGAPDWCGQLRAALARLPFADDAFCAVVVRFIGGVDVAAIAELARVLAPHGTLLVADLHPRSLWRRGVAPGRWERDLRTTGLDVIPAKRCGAPWPRAHGAAGLPHWLTRGAGGAYVVEARRNVLATLPLRKTAGRRAVEHNTLVPGAHRQCA
jgi:SAM-dependent methyltransferase